MAIKKETKARIKVKRIGIRGDEVAILFFSLVFLAFLFISFFRLLPIGKLFDDFIFLFLFGWTKYLVYLVLFSIIFPICLNYYFKIKLSFILATFFTLFAISWLVANIIFLITNLSVDDIWWKINSYDFNNLSNYFQKWWNSTIINNYHGFFVQPISFNDWKDIDSFFPSFAAGGIVANFLITICNYGFFITNWILNLVILVITISWLLFAKPWLLFAVFYFPFKPFSKYLKQKKINRISKKSLQNKNLLDSKEKNDKLAATSIANKKDIPTTSAIKQKPVVEKTLKSSVPSVAKEQKKEIMLQDVIQESGTLTPFGQVKHDQKSDSIENDD